MKKLGGNADRFLAAGIYGYQLANAGEIMRSYPGWSEKDRSALKAPLQDVCVPQSERFLRDHNDAGPSNYWANWDLCTIAGLQAIGIFNDNQTLFDRANDYFLHGNGMGALPNFITANHIEAGTNKRLAQSQEAGRDHGHATLDIALLGVVMQQAYNQGIDLFAAGSNAGQAAEVLPTLSRSNSPTEKPISSEYLAKYNVGEDVPWTNYYNPKHGTFRGISPAGRGSIRPGLELIYAHYDEGKGLNASWTRKYADMVNAGSNNVEGGGGIYGGNSGGFDGLGFGTLMYRLRL